MFMFKSLRLGVKLLIVALNNFSGAILDSMCIV